MTTKKPNIHYRFGLLEPLEVRRLLAGVGVFTDSLNIGSPTPTGSATYSNGTYSLSAGGADIGGNSDQFLFAYDAWAGDGSVVARVASLTNTNASAKAGVMLRSGTAADAAFAGVFVTPGNGLTFVTRATDGGTAGQSSFPGIAAPRYVELTRSGSAIAALVSTDGISWTQVASTSSVGLGGSALAGIAATSHDVAVTTNASFTYAGVLPAGWSVGDVGAPNSPSSAAYDPVTNTYLVNASGAGVGASADRLGFANRRLTGDGSVIARVAGVDSDPLARAGVMIRDATSTSSTFASLMRDGQNQVFFQWRSATGGASSSVQTSIGSGAIWLRISQAGSTFTAAYSQDQINWTALGSPQTATMSSATVLGGLAVSSGDDSTITSFRFSGVSMLRGGWNDSDVGGPAPIGSAIYDSASNTYSLVAGGADIYGTSDQFNFVSQTLSGSGSVIAYIDSITDTNAWAKAGLMVRRNASAADASFAGVFVSPENGIVFEWRSVDGTAVQQSVSAPPGGPAHAPVSLKLTRSGNNFSAYYSTDGSTWVLVGPAQSVALPANVAAGIAVASHADGVACSASFTGAYVGNNPPPGAGVYSASDEAFLNDLENREVNFFYNETNATTGLAPDSSNANGGGSSVSSIASIGFALSALTIADARGFLSHSAAYQRALTTINFLYNTVPNVNGFYYHFLNPATGARSGSSELSSVDTAELMAGVLNVAQYWSGTPLASTAQAMFNRVNWPWMQRSNGHFYGAWSPESGFGGDYGDFSEAVIIYLLGLGSPTHPISASSWTSWSRTPVVSYGGRTFVTASDKALFTVQYPQAWFDLRGLTEATGLNYYTNAQDATLAQRQWMTDLSSTYPQWGPNVWGLTPSDSINGYAVWGGPPAFGPINGTVVPTGPGGSLQFTPRQSVDALRYMASTYPQAFKKYGHVDAFNPQTGWTSSLVLGIDVGMMLVAAENSRSALIWNSFSQSSVSQQAKSIAFPTSTAVPVLSGVVSRKSSANGIADFSINPTGAPSVEGRVGGPTQLVLSFTGNIVKGPNFTISLTDEHGAANGTLISSSASGSTLTINLSGAATGKTLNITVSDVRTTGGSVGGDYVFAVNVLTGDANRDGAVNIVDLGLLASSWQQTVPGWTGSDYNGDGAVNIVDLGVLAANWQSQVPAALRPQELFAGPSAGAEFARKQRRDDVVTMIDELS